MTDWREVKLGDVSEVVGGGTPSTGRNEYWNGDIPWLTPRDLTGYNKTYISRGERNITELGLKNSSAKVLPKGAVLLTSRAPIGYVAISENPICTNQGFKSLIPKEEILSNIFVYYWIKSNIEYLKSVGTGTTFEEISGSVVKDLDILLPPLPEQKAIAGVLSSLDDKIDLLHRQNKTLEAMAEALFRQWFVEPCKEGLPEGWEVQPLGNLVTVKRGGSPRPIQDYLSETGLRWLKISDATKEDSPYIFEIKEHIKESGLNKTTFLEKGTLVLSNSATPGIPKILQVDSCIHDGWLHFPKSYFSKEFLYLLFKSIREELVSYGNGSIFTNLKTDILKDYKMPIPEKTQLQDFQRSVELMFKKILYNSNQIRTLEKLRDTLLPKLMSGEVRVAV